MQCDRSFTRVMILNFGDTARKHNLACRQGVFELRGQGVLACRRMLILSLFYAEAQFLWSSRGNALVDVQLLGHEESNLLLSRNQLSED